MTWTAINTWKTEMKEWWTLYWYENDTLQELVLCCLTPDSLLTSCFEMSFSIGMDAGSAPNSHLWFPEIYELEDSASSFCLSVWTYCLFVWVKFSLSSVSCSFSYLHCAPTYMQTLLMLQIYICMHWINLYLKDVLYSLICPSLKLDWDSCLTAHNWAPVLTNIR